MANREKSETGVSRRYFLKLLLASLVSSLTPRVISWWKENDAWLIGSVGDLDSITSKVPESLEGLSIPVENEWFRNAEEVFQEGLDLYEEWGKNNESLKKAQYNKPTNYLSFESAVANLDEEIRKSPEKLRDGHLGYMVLMLSSIKDFDIPYSSFFQGSSSGISNLEQMIVLDPGTGFVKKIRSSMKQKYGEGFEVWNACESKGLSEDQKNFINKEFYDWYYGAMNYVNRIREKVGEPISTSILFAYFLFKNKGDILASMWDVSTWLKILVRNDPDKDLSRDPSYERAEKAAFLFKDEFSPDISTNWVLNHVSKDDKLLNHTEDPYAFPEYKDYMPPNRAGGFYHVWNIMALSLSMSPRLLTRMVALHINPILTPEGEVFTEYGRAKVRADMMATSRAEEIVKIAENYS